MFLFKIAPGGAEQGVCVLRVPIDPSRLVLNGDITLMEIVAPGKKQYLLFRDDEPYLFSSNSPKHPIYGSFVLELEPTWKGFRYDLPNL